MATFLLTFSGMMVVYFLKFQRTVTQLGENVLREVEDRLKQYQSLQEVVMPLKFASLSDIKTIELDIKDIQNDVKGMVKSLDQFKELLPKSR